MKLQTMLLPTGEFVLVASECNPMPTEAARESLSAFRDQIGAAGILFLQQGDVDVVDAPYHDDARRTDDVGEWRDLGYVTEDEAWTLSEEDARTINSMIKPSKYENLVTTAKSGSLFIAPLTEPETITFDAQGDENLMRLLYGGAEFSPAGLVKSPGSAQEKLELGHYELTGCGRPHHIEVDSDGVAEVVSREPRNPATSGHFTDPAVIGRFPDTGPQNHVIGLESVVLGETWDDLPDPFAPGTQVEIIGNSWFGIHDDKILGQRGVIESNPHDNTPKGCALVGGLRTDEYGDMKVFFPKGSLQPIPLDLVTVVQNARATLGEQLTLDDHLVLSVN